MLLSPAYATDAHMVPFPSVILCLDITLFCGIGPAMHSCPMSTKIARFEPPRWLAATAAHLVVHLRSARLIAHLANDHYL